MNILFATSEVFPLIKTGGLADVSYNLPAALHQLDHHVGIVLPAYHSLLPMLDNATFINSWQYGEDVAEIWHTTFGPDDLPLWLVHCPKYFDRKGGPYSGYEQQSWSDNALRFGFYCRVIAAMAAGEIDLGLRFDILHCNDWQTGLAPVFLSLYPTPKQRPLTVFTIHNLAYQGVFPRDDFEQLKLPETLWQFSQLEFHGQFSFIKGGIGFADQITTVSPHYREEILTPQFGCGLEGCLHFHRSKLHGILNGIDTELWNPEKDPCIAQSFSANTLARRKANRLALIDKFNLSDDGSLLVGFIGRLAEQKGIELTLQALPELAQLPMQFIILGNGEVRYQQQLQNWATQHGGNFSVCFDFDETLAHQLVAGLDALLIPSRFEPCGLTQMYAMRYGCIPIAHAVGGLSDTINDVDTKSSKTGTGFMFSEYQYDAMINTLQSALLYYSRKAKWKRLQRNAMSIDNSWKIRAEEYLHIYKYKEYKHKETRQPEDRQSSSSRFRNTVADLLETNS